MYVDEKIEKEAVKISELISQADYDGVGRYHQDAINGFSEQLLEKMLTLLELDKSTQVLDAMSGNGNLTMRLQAYCHRNNIPLPYCTLLEISQTQAELAKDTLPKEDTTVIWGDILSFNSLDGRNLLKENAYDRIMIKSANHEIPQKNQERLYHNLYRALKPGGIFVNLGFLFENPQERDELANISKIKDQLAGMHHAVYNRYFLTRKELYKWLKTAGFVGIDSGEEFEYKINLKIVAEQYFPKSIRDQAILEMQVAQLKSFTLRENGRIIFEGINSRMNLPGEITIARKPEVSLNQ